MPLGMNQCSAQNNCEVRWQNLSVQKKMKLEKKFGRSAQQMEMAFGQLQANIVQEYQQAQAAQRANIEYMQAVGRNDTR
jgi:hypothetical protein